MKHNQLINYDQELLKIEKSLDYIPKLLLHSCCAPCSSYCIKELTPYFDITILYYNPNITDKDEYLKRKEEEVRFISLYPHHNKLDIIDCDYDPETFFKLTKGLENLPERSERCYKCYNLRLEYTALKAKELHYDYFASTLTLSPYKDSNKVNELGFILQDKYNILYLPSDFKKRGGYLESIRLSKEYNLYRQDYCGCIYSKIQKDKKKDNLIDIN